MLIADIAAGVLFGMLAGMGIGGGGLLVIYLTLIRSYAQTDAQAINLMFFVFAAAAALSVHLRKRKIDFVLVSVLVVTGVVGSLAGAKLAFVLPRVITRKLFGTMLIVSGIITTSRTVKSKKDADYNKYYTSDKNRRNN